MRYLFVLILVGVMWRASPLLGQTPEIDNGIEWLKTAQFRSGFWYEQGVPKALTTSVAAGVLYYPNRAAAESALGALLTIETGNIDDQARIISAMAAANRSVGAAVANLLQAQNETRSGAVPNAPEGGWGAASGYASTCWDTSLVLIAFHDAGYGGDLIAAIGYLLAAQNGDGGWGLAKGYPSQIASTVLSVLSLQSFAARYSVADQIASGLVWLSSQQNGDGGFGEPQSDVYLTALASDPLNRSGVCESQTVSALAFLVSTQSQDGSWGQSVSDTAMALQALLSRDHDGDGIASIDDNCSGTYNPGQVDFDADGLGDICDEDDDSDGLPDAVEDAVLGLGSLSMDSDGDGVLDGYEDYDWDGRDNLTELGDGTNVGEAEMVLSRGFNLRAFPYSVMPGYDSYQLLRDMGTADEVERILFVDALSNVLRSVAYEGGSPAGDHIPVSPGFSFIVYLTAPKVLSLPSPSVSFSLALRPGLNMSGLASFGRLVTTYGLGVDDWLGAQAFDQDHGRFRTAGHYHGSVCGVNYVVAPPMACLITVDHEVQMDPSIGHPSISIDSPTNGTSTVHQHLQVNGTVTDDPADTNSNPRVFVGVHEAIVDEGGAFVVADIPLVLGENTVTARVISASELQGVDTVTVTLLPPDYTLSPGGSATGSRSLYGAPALLDQAVSQVLAEGKVRTRDLGGTASTIQMGDAIVAQVRELLERD